MYKEQAHVIVNMKMDTWYVSHVRFTCTADTWGVVHISAADHARGNPYR